MVNIKENLWLIALVAGILGIVTIFTPAWGFADYNHFAWFWNLMVTDGEIDFIPSGEPIYDLGMITTLILVIGTAVLLFMGIFAKLKDRRFDILALIGGALLIIAPIVYFAGVESEYSGFFDYYEVNVALILPFIAGALGILAGIMGFMEKRG
jgi:hypothetical protein